MRTSSYVQAERINDLEPAFCFLRPVTRKLKIVCAGTLFATLSIGIDCLAQTILTGSGSTFAHPIYGKWISEFQKSEHNAEIHYNAIGSGGGIRQVFSGVVDFGATDGPLNDQQIAAYAEKHDDSILHFPTVLGAVVPTYNVPGLKAELKFTPGLLAGIYLGSIKKWNDPEMVKLNPDAALPAEDIVVIFRLDGSGTTYVWTDYLSKVNREWKDRVGYGTSVDWPVGWGAQGNKGVIDAVKGTPYTIAYAELTFSIVANVPYGAVQNAEGKFVKATAESIDAAADAMSAQMPADYRISITNAPGDNAYPIASYTWLLVPSHFANQAKGEVMKAFLHWALTKGQEIAPSIHYVPLPEKLAKEETLAIDQIKVDQTNVARSR